MQSHGADYAAAEQLAADAVSWAERGDSLQTQGDSYTVLAEVLVAAGRTGEAVDALETALNLYERKEIIPLARRVRARLAALQRTLT